MNINTLKLSITVFILIFQNFMYARPTKKIYALYYGTFSDGAHHLETLKELRSELAQTGLILTQNSQEADVILCDSITESVLVYQLPIIVCDAMDHTVVSRYIAEHLHHKNVIAVYKGFSIKPIQLNNAPRCSDGFHDYLINEYAHLATESIPLQLNKDNLKKIKCVPFSYYLNVLRPDFEELKKLKIDYSAERPIDLFFAGTVLYDELQEIDFIKWHRQRAVDAAQKLSNINKYVLTGDSPLSQQEYFEKMQQSKIVVSPWGCGEWCWRDFEGMLCGTIVIKPESDFIVSLPKNIYQKNITYIPCKADFSDLEEKVVMVLKNYKKYTRLRKHARSLLLQWDHTKMAKNFAENVKRDLTKSQMLH